MPSPLVNSTLQAAGLAALSNFLAQAFKAYKSGVRTPIPAEDCTD